ncbi:MAG: N-ethylmaleimide reductase [Planctomycetota bacterium]|jgi:N-ethylmaleimide reductase
MTSTKNQTLLAPFSMGALTLNNRVVMAPLTRARAGDSRQANALMAEHYAQRAGAGLLISEATTVSAQGNGWVGSPGIYTDEQGESWKQVVDAVHAAGGRIFLQLWHTGRSSHSSFHGGELPVAPSAIALVGEGVHTPDGKLDYETPRALRTEELPGIVADYVAAAERAKLAGFDGVEVHAANGYLIDQFLQTKSNQRTDEYGGSVENRYRFLGEILDGIMQVFPAQQVGVRLSPNGVFNDMGSPDFRETYLYVAQQLNQFGLAYLHVIDGLAFGFHELGEAMTLEEFRGVFGGALIGNCGYDQASAEQRIESGAADMIAFGRPFIANPDLVERFRQDWPLAESNPDSWYVGDLSAEGYTDYPAYEPVLLAEDKL